jgi:hypothetical protein
MVAISKAYFFCYSRTDLYSIERKAKVKEKNIENEKRGRN